MTKFIRELYNKPEGFIPLHAPVFRGNEKKYLEECIETTFVSSVGKFVDKFEDEIANYTGVKKAVSCVNGTNALHLALQLVGVERNTEVITQPLTFIATANAISYCGAEPVFLDVDMDTMGLSPQSLKSWLERNIKVNQTSNQPINKSTNRPISACVPMHTFGHPCRIDEIVEICNEYSIPVVEDAAESIGSLYKGKHTGTFGKIGVISFNGNKVITTGGGGMLLFNDEEIAKRAKHLTTQAKVPHAWEFNHDAIGYNYRMPNINAALGLAQLKQLPKFLQSKRKIAEKYKQFFSSPNQINFVPEPPNSQSNYWLNCILLNSKEERDSFLKYSNKNGVMTRPAWTLMNELPMFADCESYSMNNVKWLFERLVNLPSGVI
ncbi:MAG: LegC family aminotransferase [Bacteroidales bacterium]|nr:LegC family aminotransferase [Bacteroidales bacterium]